MGMLLSPDSSAVATARRREAPKVTIQRFGLTHYMRVWKAMQAFTAQRDGDTQDEFWVVEHPPVFTLGLNGRYEHLLDPGAIPVVQTDRGGQVTYHGPGQVVIYLLLDLKRLNLGARELVNAIERAIIRLLADYSLQAEARPKAPGVYVDGRKIAALGLRIRRGYSYHGLSLNIDMDLSPFMRINPCGYPGLKVTQLIEHIVMSDWWTVAHGLCAHLTSHLGYKETRVEYR
jgi:lipoyl(octanoyl) transferase